MRLVTNAERPLFGPKRQRQVTVFQQDAVRVGEEREQHLVGRRRVDGLPVDVIAAIGKGEPGIELPPVVRPGCRCWLYVASACGRRYQKTDQAGR
jgi:hypothetical protein